MNWRFWRKRKPTHAVDEWLAWEIAMHDRGFRHWAYDHPPHGAYVEVSRREWPMIQVWGVNSVHPATNVLNLWWRESKDLDDSAGGIIEERVVGVRQHQIG